MSFINDSSTQLNYSTISFLSSIPSSVTNPSLLFSDGTSGIYNATTNTIIMYTSSTTALTIDSKQCLYGNGTGLTHIQYTNIDNKPTNFQSDYNSTVINTPNLSVYATNTNLNSLSTSSTLSINNINATSTTILGNLNSLSTSSIL